MATEIICIQCKKTKKVERDRSTCNSCRSLNMRVGRGEVRAPDYPEVTTAGYKEPMQEVEGGFGYIGAITRTTDGKHIQCHICGYYFANVGAHVAFFHKLKTRDYKIKYGLRIKDGLLSPVAKLEAQERYNKNYRRTPEEIAEMSRRAKAAIKDKNIKLGGKTWSAQTRNERGNCKEQTAAKIHAIAKQMGGYPTQAALLREYGWGQQDVVQTHFGSWGEALKELGYPNWAESRAAARGERMDAALSKIADFYTNHGHTPYWSDFNGNGNLPDGATIQHYFGTLNEARYAAGVPRLVRVKRKWVEVM